MKLKKIKYENIFLIMVIIQQVDWCFKGAINEHCIIYYIFIFIIYKAIRYIRTYQEK